MGRKTEQHGYNVSAWVGTNGKAAMLRHGPNIPIPHTVGRFEEVGPCSVLGQRDPHRVADNACCDCYDI